MQQEIQSNSRLGPYVDRFEAEGWATKGPAWLQQARVKAMARFQELGGLPNTKIPTWEHSTTKALQLPRAAATPGPLDHAVLERAAFHDEVARMVLVDGKVDLSLCKTDGLPEGFQLRNLTDVWDDDAFRTSQESKLDSLDAMGCLNLAFLADGVFLQIPANAVLEHPIHIVHVHTRPSTATSTMHVILAGEQSKATVVESWVCMAPKTLTLHKTEIVASQGAKLEHVKQQLEHGEAAHMSRVEALVGRDAHINPFLWSDGGIWSRSETNVQLLHEGAACSVDGLWLGRGKQMHDCPTHIVHAAPHTNSMELYKGILDDEAHGIFVGAIEVAKDAQKVDSQQTNRNLLLSRKARVDTTPQLEIHADDVKCAHGSTIGQLDPDALFFLRARGIDKQRAELLLTKAFAGEVLSRVSSWGIRTRLERRLENWFARRNA